MGRKIKPRICETARCFTPVSRLFTLCSLIINHLDHFRQDIPLDTYAPSHYPQPTKSAYCTLVKPKSSHSMSASFLLINTHTHTQHEAIPTTVSISLTQQWELIERLSSKQIRFRILHLVIEKGRSVQLEPKRTTEVTEEVKRGQRIMSVCFLCGH